MKNTSRIALLTLFGLTLMGGLLLWHLSLREQQTEVIFLNVGQGDAILISQGSHQILIDGGRSGKELLARVGRHVPFWDRKIEFVMATHPDADHIGGLPALLRSYQVDHVLTTGAESETDISRLFQEATVSETGKKATEVFRGATLALPRGGELRLEYPLTPLPADSSTGNTNEGSIVARFVYSETSFLLTGDLPREEGVLPDEAAVSVLKVAHHGSKYSTSDRFLEMTRPKEAIISVGKNSYGHPDPGVLDRLRSKGALVRRTDESGDIRYRCLALERCLFTK